jgi:transcriptional regulator with XRE-family HTH domain
MTSASTDTPPADIATAVRARREALGMSREGLADRAGVSFKTITRIESGEVTPRPATLRVIELAFEAAA